MEEKLEQLREDRKRMRSLVTQGLAELVDFWRDELHEIENEIQLATEQREWDAATKAELAEMAAQERTS